MLNVIIDPPLDSELNYEIIFDSSSPIKETRKVLGTTRETGLVKSGLAVLTLKGDFDNYLKLSAILVIYDIVTLENIRISNSSLEAVQNIKYILPKNSKVWEMRYPTTLPKLVKVDKPIETSEKILQDFENVFLKSIIMDSEKLGEHALFSISKSRVSIKKYLNTVVTENLY